MLAVPAQAQVATPVKPPRLFTITGQVSLPNGRPASGVLVKLVTRGGVPREAFTTDSGRFEFPGMDDGGYTLVAQSLSDPNLTSETVVTDTSRTSTGNLSVNLTLRENSNSKQTGPGVIRADEIEQNVPKAARKVFLQALKFKADKDYEKARDSISQAVSLYPDYYQALSERGDILVLERKLDEAAADFAQALKISPHYAPALRGAGYCKLEKADFDGAVRDFEQSLSADPTNASTHLLFGIANLQLDRLETAKAALRKALSFNPPPLRAHIHLANVYAKERQYRDAADELHKYLEADPKTPDRAELESIEAKWRARAATPGGP